MRAGPARMRSTRPMRFGVTKGNDGVGEPDPPMAQRRAGQVSVALLGLLAVFLLTAATGYFVAQEFAYVSADRLALSAQAAAGDKKAAKAVRVMGRLSFMLS